MGPVGVSVANNTLAVVKRTKEHLSHQTVQLSQDIRLATGKDDSSRNKIKGQSKIFCVNYSARGH